jgi:hypothetical protein
MKIHPCLVLNGVPGALLQAVQEPAGGDCLEMICADFLAGAHLDNSDPKVLLSSMWHLFKFLPGEYRQAFLEHATNEVSG